MRDKPAQACRATKGLTRGCPSAKLVQQPRHQLSPQHGPISPGAAGLTARTPLSRPSPLPVCPVPPCRPHSLLHDVDLVTPAVLVLDAELQPARLDGHAVARVLRDTAPSAAAARPCRALPAARPGPTWCWYRHTLPKPPVPRRSRISQGPQPPAGCPRSAAPAGARSPAAGAGGPPRSMARPLAPALRLYCRVTARRRPRPPGAAAGSAASVAEGEVEGLEVLAESAGLRRLLGPLGGALPPVRALRLRQQRLARQHLPATTAP